MNKTEQILEKFEDFEIAFIYKYKYEGYMENSRKAIDTEIRNRNLDKVKLESLIQEFGNKKNEDGILHCPRCYSTKIAKDPVEYWNTYGRVGISDEIAAYDGIIGKQMLKDRLICIVCDYVINDPNSGGLSGLQERLSSLFRKKRNNCTR
jgi:hypothetical protein